MYGRRFHKLLLMGGARKQRPAAKIALGGVVAALMAAVMLTSYFPYLTYAIPAVAGLLVIVPMIELSPVWALMTYISASVVALLTAEKEATLLFVLFFGFYPILKSVFERLSMRWLEYLLKVITFNAAVALYVVLSVWLLEIPLSEFTTSPLGAVTVPALWLGGNVVFFLYDMGATRVISMYIMMMHPKIRKILK